MRRNQRVVLRWAFVMMTLAGVVVACAPQPGADTGDPEGVRVQVIDNPATPLHGKCVIVTHDTSQGTSIAMWCRNG